MSCKQNSINVLPYLSHVQEILQKSQQEYQVLYIRDSQECKHQESYYIKRQSEDFFFN